MVGVLLLGFVLVFALLLCWMVQAGFPLALTVVSVFVTLMIVAGRGGIAAGIIGGGVILVGGLVLATASDTYEEIRLARRRARPRRRPRVPVAVEPDVDLERERRQRRRAA